MGEVETNGRSVLRGRRSLLSIIGALNRSPGWDAPSTIPVPNFSLQCFHEDFHPALLSRRGRFGATGLPSADRNQANAVRLPVRLCRCNVGFDNRRHHETGRSSSRAAGQSECRNDWWWGATVDARSWHARNWAAVGWNLLSGKLRGWHQHSCGDVPNGADPDARGFVAGRALLDARPDQRRGAMRCWNRFPWLPWTSRCCQRCRRAVRLGEISDQHAAGALLSRYAVSAARQMRSNRRREKGSRIGRTRALFI